MFENITKSLGKAFSAFRGSGKITEANIRDGMRQVRQALLEADVAYDVVQDFVRTVTEQAIGEKVLQSLRPDEQIVGIVHQELIRLMGPVDHTLPVRRDGPSIIMMCGLQGSGKTTTCGKLAKRLLEAGQTPFLVAADLQRPAAIEQLKIIGQQIGCTVYAEDPARSNPVQVCRNGVKEARQAGAKVVILDTAGRLHVDDALMKELQQIDSSVGPDQALLVCDAMTGQDAVNSARAFNEALELDGVILTKLDGDTRGGAALSVKAVTVFRLSSLVLASSWIGWKNSTRTGWRVEFWAWATLFRSSKKPSANSTKMNCSTSRRRCSRGSSRLRTSGSRCVRFASWVRWAKS